MSSSSPSARGPKRPAAGPAAGGGTAPSASLTVRYRVAGGRDEAWRRPPARLDGAPDWPDGWVEVRRRRAAGTGGGGDGATEVGTASGPNADRDGRTGPSDPRVVTQDECAGEPSSDGGGLPPHSELKPPPERGISTGDEETVEETVEYHPPRRGGKRPRTIRSGGEARRHLAEQERRRSRREQRRPRSVPRPQHAPSRSSGRARKETSRGASSAAEGGSAEELGRIMRRGDRTSRAMRECIVLSAVLSRRRSTLDADGGFVGPGGRAYPDLRRSFGKFVDVKACALCRARVQGHWYCRIGSGHADKLDWDGGDSAREIREMYGADVEELEGRLRDLVYGTPSRGGEERSDPSAEGGRSAGGDGPRDPSVWSMDLLSDELLHHVASYVPTLPALAALASTSRRAADRLLSSRPDDPRSESLYRGVFLRAFGPGGASGNFERDLPWVSRWRMVRGLGRGFAGGGVRPVHPDVGGGGTVGILSERDERDALLYDNFDEMGAPDRITSNGYFNVSVLHLPRPPNCDAGTWEPPVVVQGDFDGVRIFPSLSHMTSPRRRDVRTVGAGAGGGPSLCLVRNDLVGTPMEDGKRRPCFFLGFASGLVGSVSARLSDGGDGYEYDMDFTCRPHEHEVTALAIVDCGCGVGALDERPVLFSSCGGGKVYSHPSALDASRDYSMDSPVQAMANRNGRGIFSMAATSVLTRDRWGRTRRRAVICTGDRDGNVRLWLQSFSLADSGLIEMLKFTAAHSYRSSSGRGGHLVTRATFLCGNVLACGTVEGDLRIWRLERTGGGEEDEGLVLKLQHDHPRAHCGPVEVLSGAGDVLLTSGGGDGRVTAWSVRTGLRLGSPRCGRGRPATGRNVDEEEDDGGERRRFYSCVVGVAIASADRHLFCLCRDGTYRRLSYVD